MFYRYFLFAILLLIGISITSEAKTSNDSLHVTSKKGKVSTIPLSNIQKIVFDDVSAGVHTEESFGVDTIVIGNFPNPTAGLTAVRFISSTAGEAMLAIFDSRGALVTEARDLRVVQGVNTFSWNACDANSRPVSSGSYRCRILIGKQVVTDQIIVVR